MIHLLLLFLLVEFAVAFSTIWRWALSLVTLFSPIDALSLEHCFTRSFSSVARAELYDSGWGKAKEWFKERVEKVAGAGAGVYDKD